MNTELPTIFNKLLKLDSEGRRLLYDVNRKYLKFGFLSFVKKEKYVELKEKLDEQWTVTGSIRELGGMCRLFQNEKISFEIDQMFCIGEIPSDKEELLIPIKGYPCYYKIKPGTQLWECLHFKDFFENVELYLKQNIDERVKQAKFALVKALSDSKNEFVNTLYIREALGKILMGVMNDDTQKFEFVGPSVRTRIEVSNAVEYINEAYQLGNFINIPKDMLNCCDSLETDNVISFKLPFWPKNNSKWFNRNGFWPEKDVMEKIKKGGCHIVPKEIRGLSSIQNCWRISFSDAEIALSETLDIFQTKCYIVAKCVYYVHIKDKLFRYENSSPEDEPNDLPSYILKTIMFSLLEQTSPDAWSEWQQSDDVFKVVSLLYSKLTTHFKTRFLQSFFTENINLLSNIPASYLDDRADISMKISQNPLEFLSFLEANWQQKSELMQTAICIAREFSEKIGYALNCCEIIENVFWESQIINRQKLNIEDLELD